MDLPKLPEGYFWRLRSDGWGYMWVEMRKKRKWFGSREIEDGLVLADPPVWSAILKTADHVLNRYNDRDAKARFLAEFRTYEGDYK
jgi:hypothetical protein